MNAMTVSIPALNPGSGTYEVKDYTITFNYTDGRKIKIAFLGTGYDISNQSPATLRMSFNEDPDDKAINTIKILYEKNSCFYFIICFSKCICTK